MDFMEALLDKIEAEDLPAPSPIEQRWTAGSTAAMSPASLPPSALTDDEASRAAMARAALFSWVGIIMYMPTAEPSQRSAITKCFQDYAKLLRDVDSSGDFNLQSHW